MNNMQKDKNSCNYNCVVIKMPSKILHVRMYIACKIQKLSSCRWVFRTSVFISAFISQKIPLLFQLKKLFDDEDCTYQPYMPNNHTLCVYACVCARVCVRTRMHVCVHVCVLYVCVCMRVCLRTRVHVCAHVCACVCVRAHVCACVRACVCACVCVSLLCSRMSSESL